MRNLTLAVLLFVVQFTTAQSLLDTTISIQIKDKDLVEIFDQLDENSPYSFYYELNTLPKDKVNFEIENKPLAVVLDEILAKTDLSYIEYSDYAIVILPRAIVKENYSITYYKALENNDEEEAAYTVGDINQLSATGLATVNLSVQDPISEEFIIGATVYIPEQNIANVTDAFGQVPLELPAGRHELKVEYIGYENFHQLIEVNSDGDLTIPLDPEAVTLQEVLVKADAIDVNIENTQVGVERLDVQAIKKLPSFMGEADVIKSLLLQPGVSNVGEGAIGFNVRGGQVDQNLVMQDEGFLFNTSHALGFFSTFNPELISFVTLYKGNIPAEFGGRLASVLDVEMRDGSFRKFKVNGGIGPVSTKLAVEGPIIKDKTSFITGFRSSYSDWILDLIKIPEVKRSSAFFLDFNARLTHKFNSNHTLILSGYTSSDRFSYNEQFGFDYSTDFGQLIFKSIYSDKLFSKITATYSDYQSTQSDLQGTDASALSNNLAYAKVKAKLSYLPQENLSLDIGASSIRYILDPGNLEPSTLISQIIERQLDDEHGLESALFINAKYDLNPKLSFSGGLRVSLYNYLGSKNLLQYNDPENPKLDEVTGSISYNKGEVISTYGSLEPRFSFRYKLDDVSSIKGGYSRTKQYINLISNTSSPTPGSQWQLSTPYIGPQSSDNFSVGYFKNFEDNLWETSVELYVRSINDVFDFKNFAQLQLNQNLETELLYGTGRAYGAELSIKKKKGLYNGALSYTFSKSERKISGINAFNYYPSNFDKPHDLSLVFNIQANKRNTITFNFNYGTGRPTTAPLASYTEVNGFVVPIYSDRNQLRIPAYHRLDFAYTLGQSYRKDRAFRTSWTFSVYNIYGRANAYSVFFTQSPFQRPIANRLAILGSAFPSLTINIISI